MDLYSQLATLNPILTYLLIISFYLGLCLVISLVTRRLTDTQVRKSHNDIAGFIFTTVGAIYGVLLAFVTVIVWDNYNKVADNAAREANVALAMYRNLSLYPNQEQAGKASESLRAFVRAVIQDEYPTMTRMQDSVTTAQALNQLWANTKNIQPQNLQEQVLFGEIITDLNNLTQLRAERLGSARRSKLTGLMRHTIMLGAIITLAFTVLFGAENIWWHILLTSMMAILIVSILFLLLQLSHPFTSGIAIKPDSYRHVLEIIKAK